MRRDHNVFHFRSKYIKLLTSGVLQHISEFLVLKNRQKICVTTRKKKFIFLSSSSVNYAKILAQQLVTSGGGDYNFFTLGQNL